MKKKRKKTFPSLLLESSVWHEELQVQEEKREQMVLDGIFSQVKQELDEFAQKFWRLQKVHPPLIGSQES